MKYLSIALVAIGFSTSALAALPAGTDPKTVTVPSLPGGLVVGVTGSYLQPSDTRGDLDYVEVDNLSSSSSSSYSTIKNISPGYSWGWGVNAGYIFPNTGNDVNVSYFNLNTDDSAATNVTSPALQLNHGALNIFNPLGLIPLSTPGFTTTSMPSLSGTQAATSKVEYNINQVDLTFGQQINVGCRFSLHPNAGVRWADLQRKLSTNSVGAGTASATALAVVNDISVTEFLSANATRVENATENSDFSGIGPLAGMDASYYIGSGFGVVGHFDSALLVGSIDDTLDVKTTQTPTNVIANGALFESLPGMNVTNHLKVGSVNRVVPVFDGKLGANYTYVFNNSSNSDLTLEVGWQVSKYYNSVDRITVAANRVTSDIAVSGPYVSLVLHV